MPSVNYRSVVHELVEIECTPVLHKGWAADGETDCESCHHKLDANSESGIDIPLREYLMEVAVAAERLKVAERLGREWSELHHSIEQDGFRRMADEEEGWSHCPEFDTDEEEAAYYARIQVQDEMRTARLAAIEAQLGTIGARMARPYEHWNEDEQLMEHLETRGDSYA